MLLRYLAKHGNMKITQITAFKEFNQSLLDFFNFVDLQLIFTLL